MVRQALFEIQGPVAVRYPRGGEGAYRADHADQAAVSLRTGPDVTILTYGVLVNNALEAAELLEKQGIRAGVVKLNRISPLDMEALAGLLDGTKVLAAVEDSFGAGCVGQRVAAILAEAGQAPKQLILQNLGKTYAPEGSVAQLEQRFGLDGAGIARAVLRGLGREETV